MAMRHFLTGLGLGLGLMSALAARGRGGSARDRGLRLVDAIGDLPDRAEGLARRMRDETRDFAYDAWTRLQDGPVPDEVLAARVRAEVSRVALRPGYLTILVDRGTVTIAGWATPEEFERLIEAVRQVKGVERVQSQFDAFGRPGLDDRPGRPAVPAGGSEYGFGPDGSEVGPELREDRRAEEFGGP